MGAERLVVISTHPVQYHAPVYREVERLGVPVTAIYGSDFSVNGYHDREFDVAFTWSTDLLSGYTSVFLSRVAEGGATSAEATTSWGLTRELKRIAPTAILVTGYWPSYLRQAILQLLIQHQRILFRAETTDHARRRTWLLEAARDLALKRFYEKCSGLLYIGKKSHEHFERLNVDNTMFFSPYCVDATVFDAGEEGRQRLRDAVRKELSLAEEEFVLVFSGKLVTRKGPDLLVDAVEKLPADIRRNVAIVFLGAGEMRAALAAKSSTLNMRFVGFQNQHQLSRYYHAGDALVLPSRSGETWGLVVNEALLHGLPCVVSTEVGCGADLVIPGETGEVCRIDGSRTLRDSLVRLFEWHHRTEAIRDRCRKQVKGYSVNDAAQGIVAAFQATIAGRAKADR